MLCIHTIVFNQRLLGVSYVPGTVLRVGDTTVNEQTSPCPCGSSVLTLKGMLSATQNPCTRQGLSPALLNNAQCLYNNQKLAAVSSRPETVTGAPDMIVD